MRRFTVAAAAFLAVVRLVAAPPQAPSLQPPADLRASIDRALSAPVLARALVAVRIDVLADPARGISDSTLYARDNGKLAMPASNMKLVTLAVAAERLGWTFEYDTRLEAVGTIANGTLDGDLVVVGGGDPSITGQDYGQAPLFSEWADALTAAGITRVNGRLIADDRLFDRDGLGAGWSWDYLTNSYAAPAGHGLTIRNQVATGAADSPAHVEIARPLGETTLTVTGSIPLGAKPIVRGAAVLHPARFFVDGLRLALADRGITVRDGTSEIEDVSPAPVSTSSTRTIATRSSAPLSALAGYFLKVSQNFYADMLLRTIGRASGGPGSVAQGVASVRETIGRWGIAPDEIVMNDGSGLSRYDYLTADAIVGVLRHVWQDERLRGPFVAALPVAGRDGTLDTRMRGTILDDRVEAKTGTLANVRSLSGYLETTTGRHLVFAILVNNFTAPAAQVDAVVEKVLTLVANQ